jgi:hypothetical protein
MDADLPDAALSLDTRGLKVFITLEDDDLVLVVSDGEQAMTFEPGAGGSAEDAIRGAEHLADMAIQYAALMKVRAGSRTPLTRLNPPPAEVEWWIEQGQFQQEPPLTRSAWADPPPINGTAPISPIGAPTEGP